jgi:hypothetical protein
MTETAHPRTATATTTVPTTVRPRTWRRVAVAVTGVVACLLPTVWTVNFLRMLATGELADHRFHQLTGQGLLLTALWLGALVPVVLAAWQGRRPGTGPAIQHLAFTGVGIACALAAPQGGSRALMVIITVTGALLWLAVPRRTRPRDAAVDIAPVSLAAALLLSAAVAPYAVGQVDLQHAATGLHADNPHYFDMAWLVLVFAVLGVAGAVLRSARGLQVWAGGGVALTGIAMLATGEGALRGGLFLAVGALLLGAWTLGRRGVRQIAGAGAGA